MKSNYFCNKGKILNNGKGDFVVVCVVVFLKKLIVVVFLVNKMICLGRYIVIKFFLFCLFFYVYFNF